jgi:hypothetical protein
MLKSTVLVKILVVMTILFWFHPINNSIAGSCDENASSGGTSTFTGNFNIPPGFECPENPTLEYDTANSAETIARNGSANLLVIGNNGPYTWSVSGTGFTLETEGQPTSPTNTLYADGSACGAATITVTGCSGAPVIGYVRCTAGAWVNFTVVCGSINYHCILPYCEAFVGPYRYRHFKCDFGGPDCMDTCEPCETSYGDCPIWECQGGQSTYGHCRALKVIERWEWKCP